MSTTNQAPTVLGGCPDCQAEIATIETLIEYEASDGRPMGWAECPACTAVVHPV